MPALERQKQKRLIIRLKNIRKFFRKNRKNDSFYGTVIASCDAIIRYEKDILESMKDGRKKK